MDGSDRDQSVHGTGQENLEIISFISTWYSNTIFEYYKKHFETSADAEFGFTLRA